jgi:hypothetical protein
MASEKEIDAREQAWAKPVAHLESKDIVGGGLNLNVDGKALTGPLQGFGQLWQKTYRVKLAGVNVKPSDVVSMWKEKLPTFMPNDSRFYPSLAGVAPGEVLLIDATVPTPVGGITVATGVMILYADDESFTEMTPDGHPESGFNTFSSYEEDGVVVAQIQSLARANDPVYEFGFRFMGGSKQQENIWHHVLTQLAASYGISGQVKTDKICVDTKMQWSRVKNVWHNAMIRTTLNAPVRVTRRILSR